MPWMSFAAGDTWTRGNWVFDSHASLIRALAKQTTAEVFTSYSNMGLSNLSGVAPNPGIALMYVANGFTTNNGALNRFPRTEIELSENVFAVKGKHQLSFGVDYRHVNLNEENYSQQNPIAVFYGVNSLIYGMYGIIPGATLNGTADFIMGAPYLFLQGDGVFSNVTGNLFGLYVEDNIRLTSRLTATAGLRWDPYLPFTPQRRVTCFVLGSKSGVFTNALPGLLFPGDSGCPKSGMPSSIAQVQPRLGLAYQLDSRGKTVVRAGYGRYDLQFPLNTYGQFSGQPWGRNYELLQPFVSIDNLWASAGLSDPFASGFHGGGYNPPNNVGFVSGLKAYTFDPNFRPGYIQQWSLSVQRLLSSRDSVEVAYLGTAGVHQTLDASLNTPVYIPGNSSTTNEQERRPYSDFADVHDLASIGTSSYNGVDVTFRHRTKTFNVTSAFTWGKALDDASTSGFNALTVQIPNLNHIFRRGRSDFDQNFVSRTTAVWSLPSIPGSNRLLQTVANGWQFSGLLILDAGQPFSVTDSADYSYTGLGIDYADRVPDQPLYVNGKLNLAAFKDNAPGTFGNSGRNAYRGPSYKDVDTALMKDLPIREQLHLTFRAEAFNLFNHPNYLPPNSAYSPTAQQTFGTYTAARDPRIMQFSLKVAF